MFSENVAREIIRLSYTTVGLSESSPLQWIITSLSETSGDSISDDVLMSISHFVIYDELEIDIEMSVSQTLEFALNGDYWEEML